MNEPIETTERERELILDALYIMEGQCAGDELHYELVDELGGTPEPEEIRALMDRIRMNDLPVKSSPATEDNLTPIIEPETKVESSEVARQPFEQPNIGKFNTIQHDRDK